MRTHAHTHTHKSLNFQELNRSEDFGTWGYWGIKYETQDEKQAKEENGGINHFWL